MRLYFTKNGTFVGTQADAGKGFTQVEVPTDKPGLIGWLNFKAADFVGWRTPAPVEEKADQGVHTAARVAGYPAEPEPAYQHMTAGNILRRMDATLAANKGAGAIAEYVGTAPPEEVALVAAAVAMRLKGAGEAPLPKGQVLDQGEG